MAMAIKMETSKISISTKRKAHTKRRHQIQVRKRRSKGSPAFLASNESNEGIGKAADEEMVTNLVIQNKKGNKNGQNQGDIKKIQNWN
jgi:hypothetical protein